MDIFVAWDGDHIGREVGRASLADDVEGLRRISQSIDLGNQIWKSWVEKHGGSLISMGGDEGRAQLPADYLDELPQIREQYAKVVDAAVSVGVGTKLSEADQALLAAKLQGGDRVVFYTEDAAKIVEEARKKGEKTEESKIADEYLNKAVPGHGEEMEHYKPHNEAAANVKLKDLGDHQGYHVFLVDGDKIRHTIDADYTMGGNPGRYKYVPEGEIWIDSNTNPDEINETIEHEIAECKSMEQRGSSYENAHDAANEKEFKKAAPAMNPGAFSGASRPSAATVSKPVATQGEHSEGQAAIDAFNEERPPSPEMTHAAKDFEDHFHDAAADQEKDDTKKAMASTKNIADVKKRVAEALMILKQQAPMLEQMKQAAPDAYAAITALAQSVVGLAREIQGGNPKQSEEPTQKGEMKVEADPQKDPDTDGDLVKDQPAAHHHVVLPVGSQLNGKIKVQHSDGKQGWKQMETGMILSQDPSGHPTSSRSPNSK